MENISPVAYIGINNNNPFVETVKENDLFKQKDLKYLELALIGKEVASVFNIRFTEIFKNTKKNEIVRPRQTAMFFANQFTKYSLAIIGKYYAERKHATVCHAKKAVNNAYDTEPEFRKKIIILYERIKEILERKEFNIIEEKENTKIVVGKRITYSEFLDLAEQLKEINLDKRTIINFVKR
jgi:hypothetical protein